MNYVMPVLIAVLFLNWGCVENESTSAGLNADMMVEPVEDARIDDSSVIGDAGPIDQMLPSDAMPDMERELDQGAQLDSMPDAALQACEPPLSVTASATSARPYDLIRLTPVGGTGAWRFALVDNQSGALLNETTGAYLAGEMSGTTDRIRLSDDGCLGDAEFAIRVVNAMEISPGGGEVERGQTFQFRVREGSGSFAFELVAARSGAEITDGGLYTAGPVTGTDIIRVEDLETGQTKDITLNVVREVVLEPRPKQLFVPVGSEADLTVEGGTGTFDVEISGPGIMIENDVVQAITAGRFEVGLTDTFTGHQTTMLVHAVESLQAELEPFDDVHIAVRTINPGDLNGDGQDDLLIAHSSADIGAGNSGAVFVYHTGPDGLDTEPTQILSGTTLDEEFGRSAAVADVDRDGLPDLVAAARLSDPGVNDAGALFVYRGEPGGLFAEAPMDVLAGIRGGDQLGFAVTICDFNGDGFPDIAGSAIAYEDRTQQPVAVTQGGVMIWLGYEDGFLAQPDQVITGLRREADGSWSQYRDLQFGSDLVSGDMDGDGRCDLVVGANRYRVNQQNNAGAVFIYPGIAADEISPGGVTDRARMMIQADGPRDNGGSFGRRLHMTDMNGDNLQDVIVAEHAGDTGGRDRGSVYIFAGGEFPEELAIPRSVLSADGTYSGNSNYDNHGIGITAGDVTGDGLPDLIVGAYVDDPPGLSNAGRVFVYAGQPDGFPVAEPTREIDGPLRDMRLGEAVAVIGDHNGDGLNDLVAHAQRDDSAFRHAGRTYLITRGPEAQDDEEGPMGDADAGAPEDPPIVDLFTPIDFPRNVGAGRFGNGVAVVGDMTGDGIEDVVVTAPFATTNEARSGGAWLYAGSADGVSAEGTYISSFPNHGYYDQVWSSTNVGDFDGDGFDDFAVLLRDDERPDNNGLRNELWLATPEDCGPRSYNTGGLYIFRGTAEGRVEFRPSFAYWEGVGGLSPEALSGNFDFNGDGRKDVVIGGYRWDADGRNNCGSEAVITGRPFSGTPNQIEVICDTYYRHEGVSAGMESGRSVVALGDLNGDGCDEYATGSRTEDRPELNDEGGVRIFYGFGGDGCFPSTRVLRLATGERFGQAGWSLARGDFDADGLSDLAIGAWQRRTDNIPVGGAWVVPGSFLRSQTPRMLGTGELGEPVLISTLGSEWVVGGLARDSQAGYSVAFAGPYLAVGAPQDFSKGVVRAGMVRIYRVSGLGIDPQPAAVLTGETARPWSRTGFSLSGGSVAGRPTFVVGALSGNGTGLDNGSAYVLRLEPVEN